MKKESEAGVAADVASYLCSHPVPDGKGFPVTAREMTRREKARFNKWKKK